MNINFVHSISRGVTQFWSKEGGVPNRKDVSYIAPNGEEIKSARHLICYLKVYAGDLKAGDFCWTSGDSLMRDLL